MSTLSLVCYAENELISSLPVSCVPMRVSPSAARMSDDFQEGNGDVAVSSSTKARDPRAKA